MLKLNSKMDELLFVVELTTAWVVFTVIFAMVIVNV